MQMQLWMIITTRGISAFTGDIHSYYAMIPHSVTDLGIPGDTELDCLEHGIVPASLDIYVFGVQESCMLQLPVGLFCGMHSRGMLSYGILSCGILSVRIFSYGSLSCRVRDAVLWDTVARDIQPGQLWDATVRKQGPYR